MIGSRTKHRMQIWRTTWADQAELREVEAS